MRQIKKPDTCQAFGVPEVGLEPTRPEGHWILSPARLPIPPLRRLSSGKFNSMKLKNQIFRLRCMNRFF